MKAKRVDKEGEEILAHCEKHSNDSVELACLCKLLFLTIWVAMFAVLSCYWDIALDIGCTDCEDLEMQFPVTYARTG